MKSCESKLRWLCNVGQMNGDSMDNIRREAARTFRSRTWEG